MTQALTVLSTDIRIHDGLYSLNDLHRAAGGKSKHQPSFWLRTDQTNELIAEIENSADMQSKAVITREGRNGGTYACKELVYAYAMWISAKFHLAVIRAFDALVSGKLEQQQEPEPPKALPYATKEQREPLVKAIRRVVKVAEARGRTLGYDEAHAIVNLKLGVEDVEHMTVEQVQQGIALAGQMLEKVVLEGEYIHRDDGDARQRQQAEDNRLTAKERAELKQAMRLTLGGLPSGDIDNAVQWLTNRLRVRFNLANLDQLTRDQLPAVHEELEGLRETMKAVYNFRAELRDFTHKEIIGAGAPWTPAVARKWKKKMKRTIPPRPDWLRMALRELGLPCPLCGQTHEDQAA